MYKKVKYTVAVEEYDGVVRPHHHSYSQIKRFNFPLSSKYKVRADLYDWKDLSYVRTNNQLRPYVDLREWASPVEDQLALGSCTANAIVGNYELLLKKEYPDQFVDLSRLFVYYNSRLIDNSVNEDTGAYLRDGLKAVRQYGVCEEKLWPYNISQFTVKPSDICYEDAKKRNIKNYYRLHSIDDILDAINNNIPVLLGMLVYETFDKITAHDNTLDVGGVYVYGGHAVSVVGYDLPKKLLLIRNSFGIDWGTDGYFWMTFAYAEEEMMDAWIFDIVVDK